MGAGCTCKKTFYYPVECDPVAFREIVMKVIAPYLRDRADPFLSEDGYAALNIVASELEAGAEVMNGKDFIGGTIYLTGPLHCGESPCQNHMCKALAHQRKLDKEEE